MVVRYLILEISRHRRLLDNELFIEAAFGNRQAVALVFFFRGSDFARFFYKKPSKIATSKDERSGAQQKRFGMSKHRL